MAEPLWSLNFLGYKTKEENMEDCISRISTLDTSRIQLNPSRVGKTQFHSFGVKTQFFGFGGKTQFLVFVEKHNFMGLVEKCNVLVLAGKCNFSVLAGKCNFLFFTEKTILRF